MCIVFSGILSYTVSNFIDSAAPLSFFSSICEKLIVLCVQRRVACVSLISVERNLGGSSDKNTGREN